MALEAGFVKSRADLLVFSSKFFHSDLLFQIGATTTYIHLQWWPLTDLKAFLHLSLFLSFNYFTLTNLCQAAYIGPGYIPIHWLPPAEVIVFVLFLLNLF